MSDRETASRILDDAESRYFSRHKGQAYIVWSQEEDLIQAIEAAVAAERETCATIIKIAEEILKFALVDNTKADTCIVSREQLGRLRAEIRARGEA
jgi:hypothetical protein